MQNSQPQAQYVQQQYDNTYNQVLTDYAANQYYQQYSQNSNKMQSSLKWNTRKKSPYSKPSSTGNCNSFYCEICKISCAGEQTYKEHCDGQKHKKKELNLKNNNNSTSTANQRSTFFCELCQVPCSGIDSFNAHLNGKSHIKVCNLQVKLGKEVPNDLIAPIMKRTTNEQKIEPSTVNQNKVKVIGTPAINFVKGECLTTTIGTVTHTTEETTGNDEKLEIINNLQANDENKNDGDKNMELNNSGIENQASNTVISDQQQSSLDTTLNSTIPFIDDQDNSINLQNNGEPVGLEFIYEYNMANSKATYYSCTLCNCKFSEKQAKEQHVRGKRHHKAFKSKSNDRSTSFKITQSTPNKPPSITSLLKNSESNNDSMINQNRPRLTNSRHQMTSSIEMEDQSFYSNIDITSFTECNYIETSNVSLLKENRFLLKKHSEIVPREDDLKNFYKHIINVEKSLKKLSDEFLDNVDELKVLLNLPIQKNVRILQGEIRAGLFGKKLMLRDERQIDLIVFCSVKPNVPLLQKIKKELSVKLDLFEGECYVLNENFEEAAIDVKATNGLTVRITFTSLYFRESNLPENAENEELYKDTDQMLNKQKCLDALTALRRFKWYQAKISPFNPCPMIIRLLRDLGKRDSIWRALTCWSLELICERVMSTCINQPSPAEAFQLIIKTIASGVLLKENNDDLLIKDPCEYEAVDALGYLTDKQRIDLTESAQKFAGFIAFNKICKVLDLEPNNLNGENNSESNEKIENKTDSAISND